MNTNTNVLSMFMHSFKLDIATEIAHRNIRLSVWDCDGRDCQIEEKLQATIEKIQNN